MSITPSNPRRLAENALWYALDERREQLRDVGLPFDERSHHHFRELHDERRLISGLCKGMGQYKKGRGDPDRLRPMAQAIKAGLDTWEHVLTRRGEPWTPYVTPEARRGATWAIEDAKDIIPFV